MSHFIRIARLLTPIISFGLVSGCSSSSPTDTVTPPPDQHGVGGIPITPGTTIGRATYPAGDTPTGGQGTPISGVDCISSEGAYHIHSHLTLFVKGEQLAIGAAIGVVPPVLTDGYAVYNPSNCFYWLHTHDATGVIHVNPGVAKDMTLGMLFDVWGYSLSRTEVAGNLGAVAVYVNGSLYNGDIRGIVFTNNEQISLQVGEPYVTPPVYAIPTAGM